MSKRIFYPQQNGERKKAKLNVTISDHNFPLSQNSEPQAADEADNWGDDNDDEILLLASQACEQAYNNDVSMLPDYSICMQPASTSTQLMFEPGPSTSKTTFNFKKPSAVPSNLLSTNLKDKCSRISSPLPGISSKVSQQIENGHVNLSDDMIFDDKIYKGHDSSNIYKQLLELQNENAKLKTENGELSEKCVMKEGETSILRTQLKSCQMAVDNARLERIQAQEKVQMEWTDKLNVASSQMRDLRTQLDFKNLEIISIKERCRMLESNKVKLTQVTVAGNDISPSHRNNSSSAQNGSIMMQTRRVKTVTSSVQTDGKARFLQLNKTCRSAPSYLTNILPYILEPTSDHHTALEYHEKLQRHTEQLHNKCRVYSTFHRVPSMPAPSKHSGGKVSLSCLHEDLTCIAAGTEMENHDKYFNVLNAIKQALLEVQSQLEGVSMKMTTAFQREMDERYIEGTSMFEVVSQEDLLSGRVLFREEQAILARRMTAVLACLLESPRSIDLFQNFEDRCRKSDKNVQFIDLIQRICTLLDNTSCALLYSGLLLSILNVAARLLEQTSSYNLPIMDIIRSVVNSRPVPFVCCQVLDSLRQLPLAEFLTKLCPGVGGNLKLDHDQGVLLFKKDSCFLQVLLKQIEVSLKCIEKYDLTEQAVRTTQSLIAFYSNVSFSSSLDLDKARCDCRLVLVQVIVYALKICAVILNGSKKISITSCQSSKENTPLLALCRSGLQLLYQCSLRDVEFGSQLGHNEGHLIEFCELLRRREHSEVYENMLTELSGTFQSSPEDTTSSFHRQAWLKGFQKFSIED